MTNLFKFIPLLLFVLLIFGAEGTLHAKKIYNSRCAEIYLRSGDSIVSANGTHVIMPKKKEKLKIIDHSYTSDNKIVDQIDPLAIESLIIWSVTAPERRHTFVYFNKIGWCHQTEHSSEMSLLCYAPKGYTCAGNGGFWFYGKANMIFIKDGVTYFFGQPHRRINKKMRNKLMTLFSDNQVALEYIQSTNKRCDKVLRTLINCNI